MYRRPSRSLKVYGGGAQKLLDVIIGYAGLCIGVGFGVGILIAHTIMFQ